MHTLQSAILGLATMLPGQIESIESATPAAISQAQKMTAARMRVLIEHLDSDRASIRNAAASEIRNHGIPYRDLIISTVTTTKIAAVRYPLTHILRFWREEELKQHWKPTMLHTPEHWTRHPPNVGQVLTMLESTGKRPINLYEVYGEETTKRTDTTQLPYPHILESHTYLEGVADLIQVHGNGYCRRTNAGALHIDTQFPFPCRQATDGNAMANIWISTNKGIGNGRLGFSMITEDSLPLHAFELNALEVRLGNGNYVDITHTVKKRLKPGDDWISLRHFEELSGMVDVRISVTAFAGTVEEFKIDDLDKSQLLTTDFCTLKYLGRSQAGAGSVRLEKDGPWIKNWGLAFLFKGPEAQDYDAANMLYSGCRINATHDNNPLLMGTTVGNGGGQGMLLTYSHLKKPTAVTIALPTSRLAQTKEFEFLDVKLPPKD